VATRAWQVRRVMDFPHAGDLMVISTVYEDGTVAALEELIGNHGGLGGEQTDAFLFHPADLPVTPTRNSVDVFHILNGRRDLPVTVGGTETAVAAQQPASDWSLANLWAGLADVRTWVPLAAKALVLDRAAYQEVVHNHKMTGPAFVLGLVLSFFQGYINADRNVGLLALMSPIGWLFGVLAVFLTGRLLTHRGSYTKTLRALGFAQAARVILLVSFVPVLAPLALFLSTTLTFIATWMGAAVAHQTRGWRTIILPLVLLFIIVLIPVMLLLMFGGVALSVESIIGQLR